MIDLDFNSESELRFRRETRQLQKELAAEEEVYWDTLSKAVSEAEKECQRLLEGVVIPGGADLIIARSIGTFVQIGDVAVNMALVVEINFGEDHIYLYYRSDRDETEIPVTLVGKEKDAFLEWWEFQASRIDIQKVKVL